MRVIFLGNNKPSAINALRFLVKESVTVAAVVAPPKDKPAIGGARLVDEANHYNIPVTTDDELYRRIQAGELSGDYSLEDIDLIISFKFWKRIKKPLIELPKIGCVNFHPYPLPEFRGLFGYNMAIYENLPYWGVSAHFVDESFDTGDIIKVLKFDIVPTLETAFSLAQKSEPFLLELFKEVIETAKSTGTLPRAPQGKGRYISRTDFESLRKINPNDTLEQIERKIRAAWFPPFPGAAIEIGGKEFTLVSDHVLKEIGQKYHGE